MIKVAVDAMGGDNAPGEIVAGAVEAVREKSGIQVALIGREELVKAELAKYTYNQEQIQVVNATEAIATEEPPVNAIRRKKDSSIVIGMNMVKKKEADAFVSAGSSGAILVGGQVIVGRIKGVERPPSGAAHSHGARSVPADRLRGQCGRALVPSRPVCTDGFHLHGARAGHQEPHGGHRQYRR